MTPKALIHQKYDAKACYRVEEVREAVDGGCPGLALPQQTRSVYRCSLDLPGLTFVTPGTFVGKKDAEQSAAQIALDKARQELSNHKDLVKLQAVIRGHLVRRQAAESLQCLLAIVKMQGDRSMSTYERQTSLREL